MVFFSCFFVHKSIDELERSTTPACPSFIAIVHKGNKESTICRLKKSVFLGIVFLIYILNDSF